jgi:hypothetical protein
MWRATLLRPAYSRTPDKSFLRNAIRALYYYAMEPKRILDVLAEAMERQPHPGPFMTDSANGDAASTGTDDRRTNEVLRALVSEMLERVREVTRRTSAWSAEERAQAEAELEAIMAHVRREATTERKED